MLFADAQVPQAEQVNTLMQLCTAATDANVQIKCIGTLECLAQHAESIDGNRVRPVFSRVHAVPRR